MSYVVTLAELSQRIRARINIENETELVDDIELNDGINVVGSDFHDLILDTAWGGNFYVRRHEFTTVVGQELYDLPDAFYRVIRLDAFFQSDRPTSVYPYQQEERNSLLLARYSVPWGPSGRLRYSREGDQLSLIPVPQSAVTCKLVYAPSWGRLSSPDDSFNSQNGWEEYLILGVCLRLLPKTGPYEAIPLMQAQQAEQVKRLKSAIPRGNDRAERTRIIESYDEYSSEPCGDPWGYGSY